MVALDLLRSDLGETKQGHQDPLPVPVPVAMRDLARSARGNDRGRKLECQE